MMYSTMRDAIILFLLSARPAASLSPVARPPTRGASLRHHHLDPDRVQPVSSRRAFLSSVAVVTVASSLSPSAAKASDAGVLLGASAPDFSLPNSEGKGNTSLGDLTSSGKWTVLYFYPGAFTSGCTLEARGFQRDISTYSKLNAQVVGVSVDPVEKNAQFCSSERLDFYMLTDKGGKVSKSYGTALSVPGFGTFSNRQTYIIKDGIVRWVFQDVESKVARHSEEVITKLMELQRAA